MSEQKYYLDSHGGVHVLPANVLPSSVASFPNDCSEITEAEAKIRSAPARTIDDLAAAAMAQVNTQYTKRMGAIADAYPLHERESWPVQLQEARDVMLYASSNAPVPETVQTPWIDQCAAQRGLTREELAARIVAKDAGYRQISGFLSGVRQNHEDQIDALLAAGEESREALQDYWYLEGWEVLQETVN